MSSSADTEDVVSVTDDGVSVTKRYAPDEFPVPAIRFEIESDREDTVSVRLTESIPESFPMDAVGFHPEYHSDQWTAYQDNRVQFTGSVEPDTSLVTVYGIRLDDEFDSTAFLTEPTIMVEGAGTASESTATDVSESVDEVVSTDGNDAVKDMLMGTRDSVPGLDSEEGESDTDEPADSSEPEIELDIDAAAERVAGETDADGEEPSSSDGTPEGERERDPATDRETESETATERETQADDPAPSNSGASTDFDGQSRSITDADSGTEHGDSDLVSELASALRSESGTDEDIRTIRNALGSSQSGSTEAKLSHLQERVEEVAAYSGALEEFLDEEGTGAQLIANVRDNVESLRSDVSSINEAVEANSAALEDLDESVSGNSDTLDSVTTSVSTLEGDLASVEDSVSALESSVSDHDDALDDVDDQVESIDSTVDELEVRTSDIESDVEENADDIEAVSETVDTIEDDLESVSEDVVDIIEWRDQLGSMFTDD